MKLNSFLVTSLLVLAFTEAVDASILDKKFVKVPDVASADFEGAYTLTDAQTELMQTDLTALLGSVPVFNAPEVDTYDR